VGWDVELLETMVHITRVEFKVLICDPGELNRPEMLLPYRDKNEEDMVWQVRFFFIFLLMCWLFYSIFQTRK